MRFFILILTLVPALAFGAKAKNSGSELFHQSRMGEAHLTPAAALLTGDLKIGSSKTDVSGYLVHLEYETGISEALAVGAGVSYTKESHDESPGTKKTLKGLGDLEFFGKYQTSLAGGTFKVQGELSVSPGDREIKANGDANNYSGGKDIHFKLVYEFKAAANTVGFYFGRDLDFGKNDVKDKFNGLNYKQGGGLETSLGAFIEMPMANQDLIGFSVERANISADTFDQNINSRENVSPLWRLSAYSRHALAGGELLPILAFATTTDDKHLGEKIHTYRVWAAGARYRFSL